MYPSKFTRMLYTQNGKHEISIIYRYIDMKKMCEITKKKILYISFVYWYYFLK